MRGIAPFLALLLISTTVSDNATGACDSPSEDTRQAIATRLREHDVDSAIALAEAAVARCPDDSASWLSLGEAYGAKARIAFPTSRLRFAKKCKAAFEKSCALDPGNIDARIALFTYLLEAPGIAGGDLSAARREAREIARLDSSRAHSVLGSLALREKDFSKAQAELTLALAAAEDDRERAELQCRLASVYESLGKSAEAVAALREARRLDPDNAEARKRLGRLDG